MRPPETTATSSGSMATIPTRSQSPPEYDHVAYHQATLHARGGGSSTAHASPRMQSCREPDCRYWVPCSRLQVSSGCGRGRSCAALLQRLLHGWLRSHRPVVLAPLPPPAPAAAAGAAATSASPGAAPGEPPSAVSEMVPVTRDRSVKPMEWSMAT